MGREKKEEMWVGYLGSWFVGKRNDLKENLKGKTIEGQRNKERRGVKEGPWVSGLKN